MLFPKEDPRDQRAGARGIIRVSLNIHPHAVHGSPIDALEARHVDVGERVALIGIAGRRGRSGR